MNIWRKVSAILLVLLVIMCLPAWGQWVTRDKRWPPRGPWLWVLQQELPQLYREFNGINFGHAHLAETLLGTQDEQKVEEARLQILDFIFSSPPVPPDEGQIAPTFVRLAWEVQKTFHWAHTLHRSLYDLFAADNVLDKENAYRKILANYLEKSEAITFHALDHHGKLWNWKESKSFVQKYTKFNTQIWAYHWLQAATYDVQLMGDAETQRRLLLPVIQHYHGYLRNPPTEWQFMPMMAEAAPEFSRRFPEAAAIFDNLHMLHDNLDDVLSRPDLYPSIADKRARILRILPIYLHRNHLPHDQYAEYHAPTEAHAHEIAAGTDIGSRPPSVQEVLGLKAQPDLQKKEPHPHDHDSSRGGH